MVAGASGAAAGDFVMALYVIIGALVVGLGALVLLRQRINTVRESQDTAETGAV